MVPDFIKEIDQSLLSSFRDIVNSYAFDNGGIYSTIQSYLELLFKNLLKRKGKFSYVQSRDSLGDILAYRFFQELLIQDYNIIELDRIREISKTANMSKHEKYIGFEDARANEYIQFTYELTYKIYEKDFKKLAKPVLVLEKKINQTDSLNKIATVVIKEAESESQKETAVLKSLLDEKELIKSQIENQKNISTERPKGILTVDQIKTIIFQKEGELNTLQELQEIKELALRSSQIDELKDQIAELEMQLHNTKFIDYNSADIMANRNAVQIVEIENKITEKEQNISRLDSIAREAIRNPKDFYNIIKKNLSCEFNSNYIIQTGFRCIGVADKSTCSYVNSNIFASIYNQLTRGKVVTTSRWLDKQNIEDSDQIKIYQLEIMLLCLIRNDFIDETIWKLNLVNESIELLELAVGDLNYRFSRIKTLSDSFTIFPKLDLVSKEYDEEYMNIYFGVMNPTESRSVTIQPINQITRLAKIWIDEFILYKVEATKEHDTILNEYLYEFFKFDSFREGQIEILRRSLNNKRTIGILTTGGGKSLIYQLVGLMQPKITIIVDPINALIFDQYRKMVREFKVERCLKVVFESETGLTAKEIIKSFDDSPPLFVYTSPERFQNKEFRDLLISLNFNQSIGLVVLDEVHCLSEWGHDFRISYLMLIHTINSYCKDVRYLGLTATAAINVMKDLQVELGIFDPANIVINKKLQRDNLNFKITEVKDSSSMMSLLKSTLDYSYNDPRLTFKLNNDETNSIIVFFKTKYQLKNMYELYLKYYVKELAQFHGDNKTEQDAFISNQKSLMFATKAFGMGVDKPNIRRTIHFGMPSSRENYFQEAGRGGRDGKRAICELYTFATTDTKTQQLVSRFLEINTPVEELSTIQQSLKDYYTDLSTNAFFMAQSIDSVENEVHRSMNLYSDLVNNRRDLVSTFRVINTKANNASQKTQQSLYMLHKIGIVRNWEVKYSGPFDNQTLDFTVSLHQYYTEWDHIKESGLKYLTQYSLNNDYIVAVEKLGNLADVSTMLLLLRKWYHSTFLRSRREQLANMVVFINQYKNGDNNQEIQTELSQFFDVSKLIESRESSDSLTFETTGIKEVFKRLVRMKETDVSQMRVTMDRLLETEENPKINIFTSMLYLRNDMFHIRNGKERLEYALDKMNGEEVREVYQNINSIIPKLSGEQVEQLLDCLVAKNPELFLVEIKVDNQSEIDYSGYFVKSLNRVMEGVL